jgi:hypothetical protein
MYGLEDIFLYDEEYLKLGGDDLFLGTYFTDNNKIFIKWVKLDNNTKNSYLYTLVKNKANNNDVNYSLNLFKAILIARYSDTETINKFTSKSDKLQYDDSLDNKYKLTLIDTIHQRLQEDNLYCMEHQNIQVNPQMHSEKYYIGLIKNIFKKDKTHKEIKNSINFETIGDKLSFILYVDDMITNNQTRLEIQDSTGIDTKQIGREDKILNYYIEAYKNRKLLA